ncbi:ribosomal 5S rRNA E-loop binding protein Ctc/L25/TL5, partial [gut metagenome]
QGEEQSPAVKVSKAIISHAVSAIEVTCFPKELPEFITVDLSTLEAGMTFHASMLQLPEGVEVHSKAGEDVVLATVALPVEEEIASAEGEEAAA